MIYLLAALMNVVVLVIVALGANKYLPPKEKRVKVDKNAVRVQIPDSLLCLLPPEHRD